MLKFSKKRIWNILYIILIVFIFFEILLGSGAVPTMVAKLVSVFKMSYFAFVIILFFMVIKNKKIDRIVFFVMLIPVWQFYVSIIMGAPLSMNMIYQIFVWPMLFVIVYIMTKDDIFQLPTLKYGSILWMVSSIYVVYILRTRMFNDVYLTYYLILAIPFLVTLKDKCKYIWVAIITIIILFTYKRTGLMCLVMGGAIYLLVNYIIQNKKSKKLRWFFILTLIFIAAIIFINNYMGILPVFRRMENISEDNGSDRFVIWNYLITTFKNDSLITKLLGHGYTGCNRVLNGVYAAAHNDFVEILLDYGLIGFINHCVYILIIIKNLFGYIKIKANCSSGYAFMIVAWFMLMMFSFVSWQSILMKLIAIYFAYMLARFKYHRDKIETT